MGVIGEVKMSVTLFIIFAFSGVIEVKTVGSFFSLDDDRPIVIFFCGWYWECIWLNFLINFIGDYTDLIQYRFKVTFFLFALILGWKLTIEVIPDILIG